jgi:hypothetical protein
MNRRRLLSWLGALPFVGVGAKAMANEAKHIQMMGVSTVDHPLLLEAVLRFQANARGELLPDGLETHCYRQRTTMH